MSYLKPTGSESTVTSLSNQVAPPSVERSKISPAPLTQQTYNSPFCPMHEVTPRTVFGTSSHGLPETLLIFIGDVHEFPSLAEEEIKISVFLVETGFFVPSFSYSPCPH